MFALPNGNMESRYLTAIAGVLAWAPLAACVADGAGGPRYAPYQFSPSPHPPAQYAPQPSAPSQGAPKEERRGNTPPGTDRTGGGPASGAILDPTGAVTKEPVLRER